MAWAIVFLAVVIALIFRPKWTLWALGVLAVGIALIAIGIEIVDKRDRAERKSKANAVKISMKYNTVGCVKDYPLDTVITNTYEKTLLKVSWKLGVYEPGRSTDFVRYPYAQMLESDHILKPGETLNLCYRIPELNGEHDLEKLIYSLNEIYSAEFQE